MCILRVGDYHTAKYAGWAEKDSNLHPKDYPRDFVPRNQNLSIPYISDHVIRPLGLVRTHHRLKTHYPPLRPGRGFLTARCR